MVGDFIIICRYHSLSHSIIVFLGRSPLSHPLMLLRLGELLAVWIHYRVLHSFIKQGYTVCQEGEWAIGIELN